MTVTAPRLGFLVALVTLAADQATKLWLLFGHGIRENGPFRLGPFVEIVEVWNRGISYGLFQQGSDAGRWMLVVVSIVAAIVFSVWLSRTTSRLSAVSIGAIIGGAVGNVIDRISHGAVFDFVLLRWENWSWYVFNVADAAIVVGVAGLLYEGLLDHRAAKAVGN